jgi:hypothetical protein
MGELGGLGLNQREGERLANSRSGLRLNLGCGLNAVEGWINVDKSFGPRLARHPHLKRMLFAAGVLDEAQFRTTWPSNIQRVNIVTGMPWPKASVDFIYSSHTFEHFTRQEARKVLIDSLRMLRRGGLVRFALPDLAALVSEYSQGKDAGDATAADRFVEKTFLATSPEGSLPRRIAIKFLHHPHRWMYDVNSFSGLLKNVGFVHVTEREFRQGECPDLDLLENRPESFFVEARKRRMSEPSIYDTVHASLDTRTSGTSPAVKPRSLPMDQGLGL